MNMPGFRFYRMPFTLLTLLCVCATGLLFKSSVWLTAGNAQTQTTIAVENKNFTRGQTDEVKITLNALGTENTISFSLEFDPLQLVFVKAELDSAAKSSDGDTATLNLNPALAASGKIGIGLTLPSGKVFAPGALPLVKVTLTARTDATALNTPLLFGNEPTVQEIFDTSATPFACHVHTKRNPNSTQYNQLQLDSDSETDSNSNARTESQNEFENRSQFLRP